MNDPKRNTTNPFRKLYDTLELAFCAILCLIAVVVTIPLAAFTLLHTVTGDPSRPSQSWWYVCFFLAAAGYVWFIWFALSSYWPRKRK